MFGKFGLDRILNRSEREPKPNPVLNDVRVLGPVLESLDTPERLYILNEKINQWARAELERLKPVWKAHGINIENHPLKSLYPYNLVQVDSLSTPRIGGKINAVQTSRQDGYRQIREEVLQSDKENTWIFVPALSLWINDVTSRDVVETGGEPHLCKFLSEFLPEIELAHTHPDHSMRHLNAEGLRPEPILVYAATPTSGDFISHTQQTLQSNHSCHFKSSVVSHYGVTSYEMTPENLRLRQGGGARSYDFDDVDPSKDPIEEIKRIVKRQERECTHMMQFEKDGKHPAFFINFEEYEE